MKRIFFFVSIFGALSLSSMNYESIRITVTGPEQSSPRKARKSYDSKTLLHRLEHDTKNLTTKDAAFAIQYGFSGELFIKLIQHLIQEGKAPTLSSLVMHDKTDRKWYIKIALYAGIKPTQFDIEYVAKNNEFFCERLFRTISGYLDYNPDKRHLFLEHIEKPDVRNVVTTLAFWQNHREIIEHLITYKDILIYSALELCYKEKLADALETVLSKFTPSDTFKKVYADYTGQSSSCAHCLPCWSSLDQEEQKIWDLYKKLDQKQNDAFAASFVRKFKQHMPTRSKYQELE